MYSLQYIANMVNADYLKKLKQNETAAKKTNTALNKDNKKINTGLKTTENRLEGIGKVLKVIAIAEVFRRGAVEVVKANKAFREQEKILLGLAKTAEAYGENENLAIKAAKELESDVLSISQAAEGLKYLLGAGFNVEEALSIGKSFKDIGAFNNVVGDMGVAFVDASKGLKTNSIELIENIGLTTKLSSTLDKAGVSYAKGIDLANNEAQRRAVLNGILKEGNKFRGNENELLETGAGKAAASEKAIDDLYKAIGERVNPVFETFNETLKTTVERFIQLIKVRGDEKEKVALKILQLTSKRYKELNEKQSLTIEQQKELQNLANRLIKAYPELGDGLKALGDENERLDKQTEIIENLMKLQNSRLEIAKEETKLEKNKEKIIENNKKILKAEIEIAEVEIKREESQGKFFRRSESDYKNWINNNKTVIEHLKEENTKLEANNWSLESLIGFLKDVAAFNPFQQIAADAEKANTSVKKIVDPYASRFGAGGSATDEESIISAAEIARKRAEAEFDAIEKVRAARLKENNYQDPYGSQYDKEGQSENARNVALASKNATIEMAASKNKELMTLDEQRKQWMYDLLDQEFDAKKEAAEKDLQLEKDNAAKKKQIREKYIGTVADTFGDLIRASSEYNKAELHDWAETQAKKELANVAIETAYGLGRFAFGDVAGGQLHMQSAAGHAIAASLLGTTAAVTGGGVTGSDTNTTTEEETETSTITQENQNLIEDFGKQGNVETLELKLDPRGAALAVYPQLNQLVNEGFTITATKVK